MGNPSTETTKTVRIALALIVLGCFTLGATVTGVYLAISHTVRRAVVDYARVLGIELDPGQVRFGPSFVQIYDGQFRALEMPGVNGTIERIDVALQGLQATRITLDTVRINAVGNPVELADGLLRYSSRLLSTHARSDGQPSLPELHWQHLSVSLKTANSLLPTASLTELTVVTNAGPSRDEFLIHTATTQIADFALGPVELAVRSQNGDFELGWGPSLHESQWHATYRSLGNDEELKFSFRPLALLDFWGRFGATTGLDAFAKSQVQGHVLALRNKASGTTKGSFTLDLTGFTPPFPPELKGYRLSDASTARADFELGALGTQMQLRGLELNNGDIRLFGHGRIDREIASLRLRAELATLLDCATLAKGWAAEQVSGELGGWTQKNTPKLVGGSVQVKIQIDAESGRPDQAKVVKRIGIGCGLRPMSVADLLNLGLPPLPDAATLGRLIKQLPAAPALPTLPKLPQMPPLFDVPPTLPLPTRPVPKWPRNVGPAQR